MNSDRPFTPFKKNGKLKITLYTDPWWKRLVARLRRQPLWHLIGAYSPNVPAGQHKTGQQDRKWNNNHGHRT